MSILPPMSGRSNSHPTEPADGNGAPLELSVGPANSREKRVVIGRIGTAEHRDLLNIDEAAKRCKFFSTLATKACCTAKPNWEAMLFSKAAETDADTERDRTRADEAAGYPPTASQTTEEPPVEVRQAAEAFLHNPSMFEELVGDLWQLDLVGEQELGVGIYLVGVSCLLPKPLGAVVQAASSSGKSYACEIGISLLPPERVISATSMTPNALYYMPKGSLVNKAVYACERPHSEPTDSDAANATTSLREMLSRGYLDKYLPVRCVDGKLCTEHIHQDGPISFVQTTTQEVIFREDETRLIALSVDESVVQTQRINRYQAEQAAGLTAPSERQAFIRAKHHHALMQLAPLEVRIPYAPLLTFPSHDLVARRAFPQLLGMIKAVALLRQHQKVVMGGIIDADAYDYSVAYRVMAPVIARMFTPLKPKLRMLLDQLISRCSAQVGADGAVTSRTFTRLECQRWVGLGETAVRGRLNELVQASYIAGIGVGRGTTHYYQVIRIPGQEADGRSLLITPDELSHQMRQATAPAQRNGPYGRT